MSQFGLTLNEAGLVYVLWNNIGESLSSHDLEWATRGAIGRPIPSDCCTPSYVKELLFRVRGKLLNSGSTRIETNFKDSSYRLVEN